MKKLLLVLALPVMIISSIQAQWPLRTCGVINIYECSQEEYNCLWLNAQRNTIGGCVSTVAGFTLAMIASAQTVTSIYTLEPNPSIGVFIFIGSVLFYTGVPVWITGAVRKSQLRRTPNFKLMKFGSMNFSPVMGISQYNNKQYLGIQLSLTF